MRIGLLGHGYWGKILLSKLNKLPDSKVVWIYTSQDDWENCDIELDWVFIATPNNTHYKQALHFIKRGINVFCEKPLTPTYKQSKKLFKSAAKHDVKLYVDDVFNYRTEQKQVCKLQHNISVVWNKISDNTLYDLLYHDLYLLYPILIQQQIQIDFPRINNVIFSYGQSDDRVHKINEINFTNSSDSNDALMEMIKKVLYDIPNYEYNKQITLFCNKIIDKIKRKL